jgi:hypothetical protein
MEGLSLRVIEVNTLPLSESLLASPLARCTTTRGQKKGRDNPAFFCVIENALPD